MKQDRHVSNQSTQHTSGRITFAGGVNRTLITFQEVAHMARRKSLPQYPRKAHRSGQARVRIAGKEVYLGLFGSAESKKKYARLIAELAASGGEPLPPPKSEFPRADGPGVAKACQNGTGGPCLELAGKLREATDLARRIDELERKLLPQSMVRAG